MFTPFLPSGGPWRPLPTVKVDTVWSKGLPFDLSCQLSRPAACPIAFPKVVSVQQLLFLTLQSELEYHVSNS